MNRFVLVPVLVSLACVLYTAKGQSPPCTSVNDCIARRFCVNPINTVCENRLCFCRPVTETTAGPTPNNPYPATPGPITPYPNAPNPNTPSPDDISGCVDDLQCQTGCRNNVACCDAQRRCQCIGQCYP